VSHLETLRRRRAAQRRLTRRSPVDDQRPIISETHLRPRKAARFAHRAHSYAMTKRLALIDGRSVRTWPSPGSAPVRPTA
jgi:hypothetical protein